MPIGMRPGKPCALWEGYSLRRAGRVWSRQVHKLTCFLRITLNLTVENYS